MANGVQLATAYVSLNVNTADLGKQIRSTFQKMQGEGKTTGTRIGTNLADGLRGSLSGSLGTRIFAPVGVAGLKWAGTAGKAIGTALRTAIVSGITAGIGAAVLGAGAVLAAGLGRLKIMQQAEVQLSLKLSPQEIKQVKADIVDVVKGTPIALDQALQAVPRAINAGLRGSDLKQYIKDIADLTASTGGQAGFDQLAIILEQVRGNGKLAGDEMNQLIQAGVDVKGILKDTFGWDDKTLAKNLKEGKVGIEEIQQAIQKNFGRDGGLSKKMGETFDGAVGNLKAATARLGANILDVIFGSENGDDPLKGAVDGVTALTGKLDEAGKWVAENKEEIRDVFTRTKDAVVSVSNAVKGVIDWFSKMWGSAQNAATKVKSSFDSASTSIGNIKMKITDVMDTVKAKFDEIFGEDGWFARQFKKLGDLVDKVRDVLGLGPATANAATPSAGGGAPFNPGPKAPSASGKPSTAPPGGMKGSFGGSGGSGIDTSGTFNTAPNAGPAAPGTQKPKNGVIAGTGKPYGLPAGTDTGGYGNPDAKKVFPDWVFKLGDRFGVKPSTYSGHQEGSGMNQGIDWVGTAATGSPEAIAQMQAFAEFLTSSKIPGLEQVIWQNPTTKKPLGLTPEGDVVNGPDGYYRDDWAGHQDHVHTRFSQNLDLSGFASGGHVRGAGSGTSDSIPAMLSNGEHVLTAKDVAAMGGQGKVYAFRNALQQGLIPGFAPGGAVDPNVVVDTQNQLRDLQKAAEIAREQQRELPEDASAMDRLQAQINLDRANRAASQYEQDVPFITSGQTPPDRSLQNNIFDSTEDLKLAKQALADAPDDIPYSQRLALNDAVLQANRRRTQSIEAANQQNAPGNYLAEFQRSMGFVPTAAGNTGVAGTSSLAGILNMGNEVVGGLIDTGASLAQTAISAAATAGAAAGTMGGAAPAGPAAGAAASYGIQVAAAIGKRLSSFGFQAASIGADSLIAQLMPFGAPRWLGYDYTSFMPQLGFQQAALTTLEKMGTDAINQRFGVGAPQIPSAELDPNSPESQLAEPGATPQNQMSVTIPGSAPLTGQVGGMDQPNQMNTDGMFTNEPWLFPVPGGGGGSWAKGGEVKVYDQGGILKPGELALNASRRPEKVLTEKQWASLSKIDQPAASGPMVKIDAIYGFSAEDVASQIESKQKLAMMRFAGRP